MKIYIGADHAGFALKEKLKKTLAKKHHLVDLTPSYITGDDYPDVAVKVARKVAKEKKTRGVLVCGSSTGVCIAANKVKGARAVQGFNEVVARFAVEREDTNVLCLSGGLVKDSIERRKFTGTALTLGKATKIVNTWLNAKFNGKTRDKRRIKKITLLEQS